MDYEKKYKESMAKMSTFLAKHNGFTISKDGEMYKELSEIFPELKESEDEKMMRVLIGGLKSYIDMYSEWYDGVSTSEIIAWLEKKCEQKAAEWSEIDKANLEDSIYFVKEFRRSNLCDNESRLQNSRTCIEWLASLKDRVLPQPKHAWSEEDEAMIAYLLQLIQNSHKEPCTKGLIAFGAEAWLKSLKDRVQPKQEWSDDDEKRMNHIIQFLEDKDRWKDSERAFPIEEDIRWLKDLKPQNRWKPSDEQIEALDEVYKTHTANNVCRRVLFNLMNDLKKLKE